MAEHSDRRNNVSFAFARPGQLGSAVIDDPPDHHGFYSRETVRYVRRAGHTELSRAGTNKMCGCVFGMAKDLRRHRNLGTCDTCRRRWLHP